MQQGINEESKSESHKVLSNNDIVLSIVRGSKEKRSFEECYGNDEESLVTSKTKSR